MFGTRDRNDAYDDMSTIRNDLGRLAETVSELVSQQSRGARSSMRNVGSSVGSLFDNARDSLSSSANSMGRVGGMMASEAADRLSHANTEIEHRIERNPFTAVLVAAGIGLVIGLMTRPRP